MKLALCVICKGDSEFDGLVKAVNSVAPYVDGVFITTSDKESSKVKAFCEHNKYHYSHRDWTDDFSAQRNFNFAQAEAYDTYDYMFWIDCDDLLVGGKHLKQVAENAKTNHLDIVFFTYWYGCAFEGEPSEESFREVQLEHMRERLIKPGTNIWKSRLHETPVPITGYEPRYSKYAYDAKERPIAIMHTSGDDLLDDKMMRNKKILELQLEEEKTAGAVDPRTVLYLQKIYSEIGTPDLCHKSIEMGEKYYLGHSGWEQEIGICYEQMGIAYGKLGENDKACQMFHLAIAAHPGQVLFYIRLAQAYFNLGKYKQCEHWMKVGASLEIQNDGNDQTNIKAMKVSYSELLLNLNWNVKKDTKKALDAAEMLYKENPTDNNKENLLFIQDANDLNNACERVDRLVEYLHSINGDQYIEPLLDSLPIAITEQPFAIKIRQQFTSARKWGRDEICYFANFGGPFFEKWDASSLSHGMGGSETAVIELSKEWSKLGYKVTVYGDPEKRGIDEFGITWLPYYFFNSRDFFNIFIDWRGWQLAGHIKCRKFYVDLHDIVNNQALSSEESRNIDKVFFKAKAHRALLTKLPQDKVCVIGNGVRII
jgi:tetratricopeptide (TPR) repeat protein